MPFIGPILDLINKFIPDKDKQAEAAKAIEIEFTKQMELKQKVVLAEANSDDKATRLWRPRFMYLCMFMILTHWLLYSIFPWFNLALSLNLWVPQSIPMPEWLVTIMEIGLGGYIGGRSIEKVTSIWKK